MRYIRLFSEVKTVCKLRRMIGRVFLVLALSVISVSAVTVQSSPAAALSLKKVKQKVKSEFNDVFQSSRSRDRKSQRANETKRIDRPSLPDAAQNGRAVSSGLITVRPVVAGVSQKRHMMLWGRHSPKFVRAGNNHYAVLLGDDQVPVIYGRADSPNATWRAVFRSKAQAHQPPTLLADGAGRLHLLYVTEPGVLRHGVFGAGAGGSVEYLGEPSTKRWGDGNHYMGAAYMRANGAIMVCASNSNTRAFRCGTTEGGKWRWPRIIANGIGGRYLYPNIEPTGQTAVVASGLYRAGTPHAMRVLNNIFSVGSNGGLIRDGRAVTYGNESVGVTYFESDIAGDGEGNVGLLVSRTSHKIGAAVAPKLYLLRSQDKFARLHPVGDLSGSSYTLVSAPESYHVIGGGLHATSRDGGQTWETGTLELPGFPQSRFHYGVAQALQDRSGSPTDKSSVSFLQELVEINTKRDFVVEVSLAWPDSVDTGSVATPAKSRRSQLR